jgi:hypothetical protein
MLLLLLWGRHGSRSRRRRRRRCRVHDSFCGGDENEEYVGYVLLFLFVLFGLDCSLHVSCFGMARTGSRHITSHHVHFIWIKIICSVKFGRCWEVIFDLQVRMCDTTGECQAGNG